jgi:hypothetical protein
LKEFDTVISQRFMDIWPVDCFDEYRKIKNSVFCLTVKGENASCECNCFKKNYFCSHSLGTKILMNLITAPTEAWAIPLGQKRKPGRPKKAGPALHRQ